MSKVLEELEQRWLTRWDEGVSGFAGVTVLDETSSGSGIMLSIMMEDVTGECWEIFAKSDIRGIQVSRDNSVLMIDGELMSLGEWQCWLPWGVLDAVIITLEELNRLSPGRAQRVAVVSEYGLDEVHEELASEGITINRVSTKGVLLESYEVYISLLGLRLLQRWRDLRGTAW